MQLVLLLEAAQDRNRVLDRRLGDEHRLEAPGERGVLLDIFAVFVERGRADAMQLAARQRRLQQVGRIHGAFGLARAHQRVQLVDEQHDAAFGRGDLLQHGFEPLLELAAVFRAGDERAHVERQQLLVAQALGHVAVHDAQRQAFRDGGLADARLADEHRIVLGAARQHLDRAADFLVAADDGIELALRRRVGQIAGIALERVVSLLGRGAVGGAALAQIVDRGVQPNRRDAGIGEDLRGLGVLLHGKRQQKPLDGDIAVARLLRDLLGLIDDLRQLRRDIELTGARARNFRDLGQSLLDSRQRLVGPAARARDQPGREPLAVVEQHFEQMFRHQPLMALAKGQRLRGLEEPFGPVGEFFEIHSCLDHCGFLPPILRRRCVQLVDIWQPPPTRKGSPP